MKISLTKRPCSLILKRYISGHAGAFVPAAKPTKRQKVDDAGSSFGDYAASLHSVSSTPSRADSDWQHSDVEADESRKKILSQLQKLNDKRARLEAQLTRIQKGSTAAAKVPDAPLFRPDTLLSAHVRTEYTFLLGEFSIFNMVS